jgi:hypothetical protein
MPTKVAQVRPSSCTWRPNLISAPSKWRSQTDPASLREVGGHDSAAAAVSQLKGWVMVGIAARGHEEAIAGGQGGGWRGGGWRGDGGRHGAPRAAGREDRCGMFE